MPGLAESVASREVGFMRSMAWLGMVGTFVMLSGACSHSPPPTPEGFCQGWVSSTCQAIAGCCPSGQSFDASLCKVSLSQTCQGGLDVDMVQEGDRAFDDGSAAACFGTIASCTDFANTSADTSYAHVMACSNMVTGIRPLGAACNATSDCARNGDFSTCYGGGAVGGGDGICAQVVHDTTTCSFSFSTNQLHLCPDGTFCDRASYKPSPTAPPEQQKYEFTASCKPLLAAGTACSTEAASCAKGLFCDFTAATPTCAPALAKNAACQGGQACAAGLACTPTPGGPGATCQSAGSFCFTP